MENAGMYTGPKSTESSWYTMEECLRASLLSDEGRNDILSISYRERERVINNTPVNGLLFQNKQTEVSCLLTSRILLAFQGSFCCFFQRNTAFQSYTLSTNNNKAGFWNILRSRRLGIGATVLPFHPLVTSSTVWSQICFLMAESLVKLPSSFPRIQGSQTPQKVK